MQYVLRLASITVTRVGEKNWNDHSQYWNSLKLGNSKSNQYMGYAYFGLF